MFIKQYQILFLQHYSYSVVSAKLIMMHGLLHCCSQQKWSTNPNIYYNIVCDWREKEGRVSGEQTLRSHVKATTKMIMVRCHGVSRRQSVIVSASQQQIPMRFQIKKKLDYGRHLAVVGSREELGAWNVSNTTANLEWRQGDIWSGEANMKPGPVEFKLVIVSDEDVVWPEGDNVSLLIPESAGAVEVTGEEGGLNLTIVEDAYNANPTTTTASSSSSSSLVDTADVHETIEVHHEELSLRFLQSLKVAELKAMCKERGLAVSGKKADLIDRLTDVS